MFSDFSEYFCRSQRTKRNTWEFMSINMSVIRFLFEYVLHILESAKPLPLWRCLRPLAGITSPSSGNCTTKWWYQKVEEDSKFPMSVKTTPKLVLKRLSPLTFVGDQTTHHHCSHHHLHSCRHHGTLEHHGTPWKSLYHLDNIISQRAYYLTCL